MFYNVLEIVLFHFHSLRQIDKIILELELFLVPDLLQKLTVGYIFLDGYRLLPSDTHSIVFDFSELDLQRALH